MVAIKEGVWVVDSNLGQGLVVAEEEVRGKYVALDNGGFVWRQAEDLNLA